MRNGLGGYVRAAFWLVAALAAGFVFIKFFSAFAPVVAAFAAAYLLEPLTEGLQRLFDKKRVKERRTAGTLALFAVIAGVAGVCLFRLYKAVGNAGFARGAAERVNWLAAEFNDFYLSLRLNLIEWGVGDYAAGALDGAMDAFAGLSAGVAGVAAGAAKNVVGFASGLFVGLIVTFYFLRDKNVLKGRLKSTLSRLLSPRAYENCVGAGYTLHTLFSGYIRGQFTDAFIMAGLLSLGLGLCGVKFSFVIGVLSGLANIIPYFGSITAFFVAVAAAFVTGTPRQAVMAAAVILVLQQIDAMFINPKVVGHKVELSPLSVIIALCVAGRLWGFWGLLCGVPIFACLKVFVSQAVEAYSRHQNQAPSYPVQKE